MSQMFLRRAADTAQRGVVFGLMSFAGFQLYQIAVNVSTGVVDHPVMQSTYFKDVAEIVKTEDEKGYQVDKREWYGEEDDSYLKKQVRANITKPEFREQQQRK